MNEKQIKNFAALLYYQAPKKGKKETVAFEKKSRKSQEYYIKKAKEAVNALSKLNLEVIEQSKMPKKIDEDRMVEFVTKTIEDFVKQLKKPKDIAKFFPAKELAYRIIKTKQ